MRIKRLALIILANMGLVVGSLLFVELALQIASALFVDVGHITSEPFIEDDVLGLRGNPEWWEHDARGYRNLSAINSATIVALGDSQTYGTGVDAEESWPYVLSKLLGEAVYNMGIGSYGQMQNSENLSTALSLNPKLVILALYFGNDFVDNFLFAKKNELLESYASSGTLRQIFKLESQITLEDEINSLFLSGGIEAGSSRWFKIWLSKNSKLYALLRRLKSQLLSVFKGTNALLGRDFDRARENLSVRQSPFLSIYDGRTWKTIFTPMYRFRALDDSDPRIRIGIEIAKSKLNEMHNRVAQVGANCVVLLLPTKEYVFWPRVENPNEHKYLGELVGNEGRIRNELKKYMQEQKIDFIDPVTNLQSSEKQPYFPDGDGHPNAVGHRILAETVLEFLKGGPELQIVSP